MIVLVNITFWRNAGDHGVLIRSFGSETSGYLKVCFRYMMGGFCLFKWPSPRLLIRLTILATNFGKLGVFHLALQLATRKGFSAVFCLLSFKEASFS